MAETELKAHLTVLDEASENLKKIGHGLAGVAHAAEHANQAAEHLNHANFGAIGHHLGHISHQLHGVHHGVIEMGASLGELHGRLVETLPMLGSLAIPLSAAGMFELVNKVAEGSAAFGKMAAEIGISRGALSGLDYAAKMLDVEPEGMNAGLVKLNKTMATAAGGQNAKALAIFRHLHIALRDSHGRARTVADVMPQIADAMEKTADPTMRTYFATQMFGKAGADLIPVLAEGSKGLEEWAAVAKKIKYPLDPGAKKDFEDFHQQWMELTDTVKSAGQGIARVMAPILTPVMEKLRDDILAHRTEVVGAVQDLAKQLSGIVMKIDATQIITALTDVRDGIKQVTDAFGGMQTVIGYALDAAIAVVAAKVLQMNIEMMSNPITAAAVITTVAGAYLYNHRHDDLPLPDPRALPKLPTSQFTGTTMMPTVPQLTAPPTMHFSGTTMVPGPPAPSTPPISPDEIAHSYFGANIFQLLGIKPLQLDMPTENGPTHIIVDFNNVPSGVTVNMQERGRSASDVETHVGYAMPQTAR